tara:strand:- start:532 stop:1080 length:549 start_codon:yes stop_codon:yes gene_type:complete
MSAKINLMPEGFKEPKGKGDTRFLFGSLGLLGLVILAFVLFAVLSLLVRKESKGLEQETDLVLQEIDAAKILDGGLNVDNLPRLKNLLDRHTHWSKVFPEIEEFTLPNVNFSNFSGSLKSGVPSISFSGKAANFRELARQITAFRSNEVFEEVEFSSQGVSKDGGIGFQISINLLPNSLIEL